MSSKLTSMHSTMQPSPPPGALRQPPIKIIPVQTKNLCFTLFVCFFCTFSFAFIFFQSSLGLFLLAPYVNHDAYPSATRVLHGDVMFVRACRDLKAGTEITDTYVEVMQPLCNRSYQLIGFVGNSSDCCCDRDILEKAVLEPTKVIDTKMKYEFFDKIRQVHKSVMKIEKYCI